MTSPRKPRAGGSPSAKGQAARRMAQPALDKAIEVLHDPATRELLIEQGQKLADAGQRWVEKRRAAKRREVRQADAGPGLAARVGASAGQMFGQRKLERRVDRVRAAIDDVTDGRPDLDAALEPVRDALDLVGDNLTVSAALPLGKRKKAHLRIDRQLDRLENELFESIFAQGGDAEAVSSPKDDVDDER